MSNEKAVIYAQLGETLIPLGVEVVSHIIQNMREPSKEALEYLAMSDDLAKGIIKKAEDGN